MTPEEFVATETADLQQFISWWRAEQSGLNPEHFPEEMELGDWWEQYMMWCESRGTE